MNDNFIQRIEQARLARRETIAKFRFEQVVELELQSSKITAFVRNVSMMDLVFTGALPEPLIDVIDGMQQAGAQEVDLKKIARNGAEFRQMIDALVMIAVVEPPIAEKGDDEHIGIAELPSDDKMTIYNWINREVLAVHSFRQSNEPVEATQPGGNILETSE